MQPNKLNDTIENVNNMISQTTEELTQLTVSFESITTTTETKSKHDEEDEEVPIPGLKRGCYAIFIDDTDERLYLKPRDADMHCYIARVMDFGPDFIDFVTKEDDIFCRRCINSKDLNDTNFQYLIPFNAQLIYKLDNYTDFNTYDVDPYMSDDETHQKITELKQIIVEEWNIKLVEDIPKTEKYYHNYRNIFQYYLSIYTKIDEFVSAIYHDIETASDIEDGEIQYLNLLIPINYPLLYTISSPRAVEFGDGGSWIQQYHIWCCHTLPLDPIQYKTLKYSFNIIADKNQDFRENEPIQNIIDPSLYVHKLSRNTFQELYDKYCKQRDHAFSPTGYYHNYPKNCVVDRAEKSMKLWNIRGNYQWIATVFKEENDKVEIVSDIHNIGARTESIFNDKLYNSIEHIFENMLPLFKQFNIFKNRELNEFKVIVKSQRYLIKQNHGYSGKWHIEGLTENIALVGIYYYEWDKGLNGGNLKFRSVQAPREFYGKQNWFTFDTQCDEGTAIVFDNNMFAHRVRMLKNESNNSMKPLQRSFLAFFIIDPEQTKEINIKTTRDIGTMKREKYLKILKDILQQSYGLNYVEMDIIFLICDYGDCGITLQKAKKIRSEFIDIKKGAHTKFGEVTFGNCGYMYFLNKHENFVEYELVASTESAI
eukprot:322218_1